MALAANASTFSNRAAKVIYMETFKERMKRIRTRAGYKSQQAAATAIGCERGTVGMWEAPSSLVSSLSEEYLFAVARAYRVKPEWINQLDNKHDGYPLGGGDTQVLSSGRNSSPSEPARPDNLTEMERKSIARIEAAAAKIGGKAEAFLEGMADVLESKLGTPSEDVGVLSKKQYALVRAAQFLAGTVPDAQAHAVANLIYTFSAADHGDGVPVFTEKDLQDLRDGERKRLRDRGVLFK